MNTAPHVTSTAALWRIFCDGTALPNPGVIGIGVVLMSPTGMNFTLSESWGTRGCNNEAEIAALIAALQLARSHSARHIHIQCDSAVVIEQTTGTTRTRIARLAKPFAQARALLATFDSASMHLISRRNNTEADTLARASLGLGPKLPVEDRGHNKRRRG